MKKSIEPFSLAVARAGALAAFFLLGLALTIRPYLSYPCTYFHLVQLHTALIETAALTATASVRHHQNRNGTSPIGGPLQKDFAPQRQKGLLLFPTEAL